MVNEKIFEFLEAGRSSLRKSNFEFEDPTGQKTAHAPFFTSLLLNESESYDLNVLNGGLIRKVVPQGKEYMCKVSIRMGDYGLGGGKGFETFVMMKDLEEKSSLDKMWHSTNSVFWRCMEDYGKRKLDSIGSKDARQKYLFFSRGPIEKFIGDETNLDFDLNETEDLLKKVTGDLFGGDLLACEADFKTYKEDKYFINSENSKIFMSYMRYCVHLKMRMVDSKNRVIPHNKVFYSLDKEGLPTYDDLMEKGEKLKKELSDIVNSPIQKNDVYPVIIDPSNHGVLWHEVVGHALEGHRMQEDQWGGKTSLFLGKLGEKVAPEFISLYDDPTIKELDGHYPFDDEGVRGQRVELIKDGVLKNYLHSRQSAGFFKTGSNGHARSSKSNEPTPRMSNLIMESSNSVSLDELKENLIKECERQGKDYGLIFEGCGGGLTLPEESYFQTYPSKVFRLNRDGSMKQVRGVYVVGTPYQVMANIIQTSNEFGIFKGICGAESGFIPSIQRTPHALISALEINRIPKDSYAEMKDIIVPKPKL